MSQLQMILKLIKERKISEVVPYITSDHFIRQHYEAGSFEYSYLINALIDQNYSKAEELIEYLIEHNEE